MERERIVAMALGSCVAAVALFCCRVDSNIIIDEPFVIIFMKMSQY